jgi:hypothetical protein
MDLEDLIKTVTASYNDILFTSLLYLSLSHLLPEASQPGHSLSSLVTLICIYELYIRLWLTDISESCVVQHLKVSRDKNRIDLICDNCAVQHSLSDYVEGAAYFNFHKGCSELPEFNRWCKISGEGFTQKSILLISRTYRSRFRYFKNRLYLENVSFSPM